jgi:tetratricopeptide (TPR) repeat protein
VQNGQLERAREIFEQLIEVEPGNAAHQQEYRQVCARLDPSAQGLPANPEVPQSLEEFRNTSEPELPPQNYSPEIADSISAALTEAELYESLSSKAQGITILERALHKAADDLRLNHELARLYRQDGNGSKAARCYFTMQRVLERLGAKPAADYYGDLAISAGRVANTWEAQGSDFSASEFKLDESLGGTSEFTPAEFSLHDDATSGTEEIDLSDEWQSVWTEDSSEHAGDSHKAGRSTPSSSLSAAKIPELLEEAHFCLDQQIWDEAESAINNLARIFADHPELPALRERLKRGKEKPATPAATAAVGRDFYGGFSNDDAVELEISGARTASDPLSSLAADLDSALGDEFIAGSQPSAPAAAAARKGSAPAAPKAAPQPEPEPQSSVFGDLLEDFERELGAQQSATANAEDPETHFSLGMAFRDMGLLDEAIGELQKVCRLTKSISPQRAHQAYVWLATCLVEKSVPEASFKWFERALETAPDEESHNAVNYELANAYEAAGRKKEALDRFLEVYGSNIDYRDVASRIRDLRASF